MKPGWKTSEFWTASIAQVLALLTVIGLITNKDSESLSEALTKIVGAVVALIVNGTVVVQYIRSRLFLKTLQSKEAANGFVLLIAAIGLLILPCDVQAQNILPWRNQVEQRLKDQNLLIQGLIIAQGQRQAPPSPQAPIIINPQPRESLPIQGEPKQQLPIQGEPKQQLPPSGEPKQQLPPGGLPKQDLPIQGDPRQPLDRPGQQAGPQAYTIRIRAIARPLIAE